MGMVKVDIHKRERQLEDIYPLHTVEGVKALLENIHYVREARFKVGDFDACNMLIDFENAVKKTKLTKRQRSVLYLTYELDFDQVEVAQKLGIHKVTVGEHLQTAIKKITEKHQGGY